MTEQEMWDAVVRCDTGCDGVFFYAVKTTGIFCRPSCRAKQPKRENICFFPTAAEAEAAGFRPCKRCRSDLLEYQPMREIADQVRQKIDEAFDAQSNLHDRLGGIGLTQRRLTDIFKDEYGMTPKEYGDSLRLRAAKRRLTATRDRVIDIAYGTGFSSLSAFHRFFKQETGLTPTEYRRAGGQSGQPSPGADTAP